ncbi:hypothetical protein B296_00011330 [Ensete ventricosum]|uniref:Uncharacterized protein n=1 Tax=Ensete ventricosum TaxID=4639 RepID=A0A426XIG2_ENSVE|nr:hypothetical protein B296_00011330 [Ensete ventricosum]
MGEEGDKRSIELRESKEGTSGILTNHGMPKQGMHRGGGSRKESVRWQLVVHALRSVVSSTVGEAAKRAKFPSITVVAFYVLTFRIFVDAAVEKQRMSSSEEGIVVLKNGREGRVTRNKLGLMRTAMPDVHNEHGVGFS